MGYKQTHAQTLISNLAPGSYCLVFHWAIITPIHLTEYCKREDACCSSAGIAPVKDWTENVFNQAVFIAKRIDPQEVPLVQRS